MAVGDAKNNAENISKTLNINFDYVKQLSKYIERIFNYNLKVDQVKLLKAIIANEMINDSSSFGKFNIVNIELEEKIIIVYEIDEK